MLGEVPATRLRLIERVVRAAQEISAKPLPAATAEFLRAYFRGVAEEDLAAREPQYLAAGALEHLRLGRVRPGGRPLVGVFELHSPRTLVAVVTRDSPFLVDSLGIVFSRAAIGVHLIVHPVLAVERDGTGRLRRIDPSGTAGVRESWQLIEIDRQHDPRSIESLQRQILATLADVRAAVTDWSTMRERVQEIARSLAAAPAPVPGAEAREVQALLEWMIDDHFTFLGYRHYQLRRGRASDRLLPDAPSGLGVLRVRRGTGAPRPMSLTGELRRRAREPSLLIVTKANSIATVHRATYLDYVGIKTFDGRGRVSGEHRLLGLWTSSAYHLSPHDIPVLRHKVAQVVRHFNLAPDSHDAKAVMHVLETYPRDELFQATVPELVHIVRGVVNLYERNQVRLLVRRDAFERFYSCLVYVPRDRYNTEVRARIESILLKELGGPDATVEAQVQLSESTLARLHIVVRTEPARRTRIDTTHIERAIAAAATTWADRLRGELAARMDEAAALATGRRYAAAFPAAYTEDVEPRDALADIADLEALRSDAHVLRVSLHRPAAQRAERMHLKIVKLGEPVPISDVMPMMENFGLRVIAERPYEIAWPEGGSAWIQDFELEHREHARIDIARIDAPFREAYIAVWRGEVENDGFNRLLLAAGLAAHEIAVLRAYCRYLLQTGITFSQTYMERVLAGNAVIARSLFRLFAQRLAPPENGAARRSERLKAAIERGLDGVKSLDEDRILRAYLHVILATVRTNYYQPDEFGHSKPYVCFKLDPQSIPELPLPRPRFEIFVYSPRVEAVHLRMAAVARGGIRWSDRREDFRTEILGLMKAQNVKNTVIVPMGAKGGFVVKRPPAAREELAREVIDCYRTFMRGLLDLTDNIIAGKIVPPARVRRLDADDPYLVVAADKGTASFSDVANAISLERGFWLGDAFASGGSAGYDHKKMAITARGAWECVKRHFRELGTDIQREDFTVCGIGDMSGDVFGNGMLLSRHILLRAAFDHRHIFLDPAPDARASFAERARLAALPRSSWDDYDRGCISRGGGVYARSAKSIALSREAQAMLGLEAAAATPQELIRAVLRMPVDLLWNGGIGTYVKATGETHAEIGDRANDGVRVNGAELAAKVVGEGGNLGMSQRGRIEYALRGGRLNTDFIDNSAGVNTSDVEVNIKILLNPLEQAGKLRHAARNRLLASMTDAVAQLVLRNNYLQGQALSVLQLQAGARLPEYQHLIRSLERSGDLNRAIEFLPDDEELADRHKRGAGLARPELAVVLSYSKIWLSHHLIDSDVPEDPYLANELDRYFPEPIRSRFAAAIPRHRLRREIIVTATTNSLINRMGPTFVPRAQEDSGAEPARIARAYTAAREIFDMRRLWAQIEALDNRAPAPLQYEMMYETSRLLRHMTYWLLRHRRELKIDVAVAELGGGVRELTEIIGRALTGVWRERFEAVRRRYVEAGIAAPLAERIGSLDALNAALDIVELAAVRRASITATAATYFDVGARIGLDWLRDQVEHLAVEGSWQAVARTELRDGALRAHRRIAERVLARGGRGIASARVTEWIAAAGKDLEYWQRMLADMRSTGAADFATLSVGVESVRKLAA